MPRTSANMAIVMTYVTKRGTEAQMVVMPVSAISTKRRDREKRQQYKR